MYVVTPVNCPKWPMWKLFVSFALGWLLFPVIMRTALLADQQKGQTHSSLSAPKKASMLFEPAELEKRLRQKRLRIVDTRSKDQYVKEHIPEAVWVNVQTWKKLGKSEGGFHNSKAWAKQVGQLGMDDNSQVVVLGSRLSDTARIWWTLKYLGLKDVKILNGGWDVWLKEKRPTNTATPKITGTQYKPKFQPDRLEEVGTLKKSLKSGKVKVVDARSTDEFTGKELRGKRGGHIPGAAHLEWKELLAVDGRFKTKERLKELFSKRGILPDKTAVCY